MKCHKLQFLIAISTILICGQNAIAGESAVNAPDKDWKQTNVSAIAAMRAEKYEEAEKLFQQALNECKTPDDKKTVNANLCILLRKIGREDEAVKLMGEVQLNAGPRSHTPSESAASSEPVKRETPVTANPKTVQSNDLSSYIKQLDEQIKNADSKGDLEHLQNLFKLKADAVRTKDKGESLEYSYILHFRSQVLHHLHRDAEANSLERYAIQVRDQNRLIQQQIAQQQMMQQQSQQHQSGYPGDYNSFYSREAQAPSKTKSSLSSFNTYFDPTPPAVINMPTTDYTPGSSSTYLDSNLRNTIDRNTTNIHKTQSAGSLLNSERSFGR